MAAAGVKASKNVTDPACNTGVAGLVISLTAVLLSSRFLHFFLKRLGQPRVVSEAIVGMVLGNTGILPSFDNKVPRMVRWVSEMGIASHFFVTGLEMEPRRLLRRPTKQLLLGYASVLSTYLAVLCAYPLLQAEFKPTHQWRYGIAMALVLSNTSSSVLTRLVTDLKIGKSKIGRLVVAAAVHADMVTMLVMCVFLCGQVGDPSSHREQSLSVPRTVAVIVLLGLQTWFLLRVFVRGIEWVNGKNPEGRPMNKNHIGTIVLALIFLWSFSTSFGFNGTLDAFVIGLALPREGRVSRLLIRNINIAMNEFVFPLYYAFLGTILSFKNWHGLRSLMDLLLILLVGVVGKVAGTLIVAVQMGYAVPEAICLGLLLNVKGHFHILSGINSLEIGVVSHDGFLTFVIAVLATIVYIPLVALFIVRRARRRYGKQQLTIQWHSRDAELRMIMCLHGVHNVPYAIKIIEATRGGPLSPPLTVYAMDLVELTGRMAAALTYGHEMDAVDVADEEIIEMRKQINLAFSSYLNDSGDGVTVRRLLILSNYSTMHQDICNTAHDALAVLIILPFHRMQKIDGSLDDGKAEFRLVNKK